MAEGKKAAPASPSAPAPAKQAAVKSQPSAKPTSEPAPEMQASAAEVPGTASLKTGKVKWFNAVRGFGFITPDDDTADLFVHQTSIYAEGFRSLREGEVVEYVVELGDDGRMRANNVTGPKGAFVEGAPRDEDGGYYGGNGGGRDGYFGAGRGRGRVGSAGFGYGGFVCYACNQPGHLARDCNLNGGCYKCGKKGHFARDCPSQN